MDDGKYTFVANSYISPLEKDFKTDANGARAFKGEFSLWCRNTKAFCERPFALQLQQPEKDKQNVHVFPLLENICDAHGYFHPFRNL